MSVNKAIIKSMANVFPEILWYVPAEEQKIFLTFDDGPDVAATPPILRILADFNLPATFFLSGEKVTAARHHAVSFDYASHLLGNHGYFHRSKMFIHNSLIQHDIQFTQKIIDKHFGRTPRFIRPPFGIFGPALRRVAANLKLQITMWSLMSNDFKWVPEKVLEHLTNRIFGGAIVVFHDNEKSFPTTIKVLPKFIEYCLKEGFTFGALPERQGTE